LTRRVEQTKRFEKAFRKIKDTRRQRAIIDAIARLFDDPRHPALNFERIRSTERMWTIRSSLKDRVLIEHDPDADPDLFTLIDVGPHDIYRRYG
jgi:hypothetical protein